MGVRFEYQTLDRSRREIRLLELLPSNHQLSKFRPACRTFHASLDKNPPFLALSYVWGDPNDGEVILVDERRFQVTRNLFDAMMGVRETESLIIWIDAICINQADNEERGWQVSLMDNIYRQASKVLAWLGPSADDSDAVIDYLQKLGAKAEICGLHNGPEPCMRIWHAMTTTPSYMDDPTKVVSISWLDGRMLPVSKFALQLLFDSISGWKSQDRLLPMAGLKSLFRRAWWGRVWVLQEIALPENADFVCGTKRISRRRFRAAFNAYYALWSTLASRMQQQQYLTLYQVGVTLMTSHRVQVMLTMSGIHQRQQFPLVALLRATCVGSVHHLQQDGYQHLESTNPLDKIFALLGLSKDQQELQALGVIPDYTESEEQVPRVYTTTMAALLRQGHTSLLSHCRYSQASNGLPSWVLDWTLPMSETLQDVEPDHLTLYPKFNASGQNSTKHNFPRNYRGGEEFSVVSNIYDRILRIGDVPRVPGSGTCISSIDWLSEILRLTYAAPDIYANFSARLHAVVRASHADIAYGHDAKLARVDRFDDAVSIFKSKVASVTPKDVRLQLRHFLAGREVANILKITRGDPTRLFNEFMRMTSGRSPFVTEKGHLGLGSSYIKQGDVIALISGAQVPFILRRRDLGNYTIVSEAYVDGIMDGEAAETGEWKHITLV